MSLPSSSSTNGASDLVTTLFNVRSSKVRIREITTQTEAALHYAQRVHDRRLTLANSDRARPPPDNGSLAESKVRKRNQRVTKRALSVLRRRERGGGEIIKGSKNRRKVERLSNEKREKVELSRRERKELGLEVIDEQPTYASMLPLYSIWSDYICSLIGLTNAKGSPSNYLSRTNASTGEETWRVEPHSVPAMQAALAKADFCGAWITVTKAANPTLVGLSGIVLRETEQTFVIVPPPVPPTAPSEGATSAAKTNELRSKAYMKTVRIIPKHALQLRLSIPLPPILLSSRATSMQLDTPAANASIGARQTLDFTLYGEQLRYLLANRAARKFKARKTIDI